MARVELEFQAQDRVSTDITTIRRTIVDINKELARNNRLARTSDEATRRQIKSKNEELRIERAVLTASRQSLNIRLQGIKSEESALRGLTRARLDFLAQVSIGAERVNRPLTNLTSNFITAAANMQTFEQTIRVTSDSAEEAEEKLNALLKQTIDLVGIDTGDLIKFVGRVERATGSFDDAQIAVAAVTKSISEQGKSSAVTARVMEQWVQALQSGRVVGQDFLPIIREMPQLFDAATTTAGQTVNSIEDLRNAAEDSGNVTQFLVDVLKEIDRTSQGANLDTFNAQLDILQDQARILSSEIGAELLPALTDFLKFLNSIIQELRNLPSEAKFVIGALTSVGAGVTALTAILGTGIIAVNAFTGSLAAATGVGAGAAGGGVLGLAAAATGAIPALAVGAGIAGAATAAAVAVNRLATISNRGVIEIRRLGEESSITAEEINSYRQVLVDNERATKNFSQAQAEASITLETIKRTALETGEAIQRVSIEQAKAIQNIPGGIDLNPDIFQSIRRSAEETGRGTIIIGVEADTTQAHQQIQELGREIERIGAQINIELGTATELFHNPTADAFAGSAGRSSLSGFEADLRANQIRNAQDFSRFFTDEFFADALRTGIATGQAAVSQQFRDSLSNFLGSDFVNALPTETADAERGGITTINLVVGDRVFKAFDITEQQLTNDSRV